MRESSPIRGDIPVDEQLDSFAIWLRDSVSIPRYRAKDIETLIARSKRWSLDPVQLKTLPAAVAIQMELPYGILDLARAEVSHWRRKWNSSLREL